MPINITAQGNQSEFTVAETLTQHVTNITLSPDQKTALAPLAQADTPQSVVDRVLDLAKTNAPLLLTVAQIIKTFL